MENKINIKTLKSLLILVDKHKLDSLEINGVKITKSKHMQEEISIQKPNESEQPTEDDLLFWSVQ